MARTNLTRSARQRICFDHFIDEHITTRAEAERVGAYLNCSADNVLGKKYGRIRWTLDQALDVIEFYGGSPEEVFR